MRILRSLLAATLGGLLTLAVAAGPAGADDPGFTVRVEAVTDQGAWMATGYPGRMRVEGPLHVGDSFGGGLFVIDAIDVAAACVSSSGYGWLYLCGTPGAPAPTAVAAAAPAPTVPPTTVPPVTAPPVTAPSTTTTVAPTTTTTMPPPTTVAPTTTVPATTTTSTTVPVEDAGDDDRLVLAADTASYRAGTAESGNPLLLAGGLAATLACVALLTVGIRRRTQDPEAPPAP